MGRQKRLTSFKLGKRLLSFARHYSDHQDRLGFFKNIKKEKGRKEWKMIDKKEKEKERKQTEGKSRDLDQLIYSCTSLLPGSPHLHIGSDEQSNNRLMNRKHSLQKETPRFHCILWLHCYCGLRGNPLPICHIVPVWYVILILCKVWLWMVTILATQNNFFVLFCSWGWRLSGKCCCIDTAPLICR